MFICKCLARKLLPLLPLLAAVILQGQTVRMQELTIRDGLSQGFVPCMFQDSEGFLWFGTKNGLNRYDGYRFEVFTNDPYDENSLSSDYINCLHEVGDYLLVGTTDGGLNFFHKKTRRVIRLAGSIKGAPNQFERWSIYWVFTDAEGNIWATAGLDGEPDLVCKIILPPNFWKRPFGNAAWQQQIYAQTWKKPITLEVAMRAGGKSMYVPTAEGLYEVDTKTGEWKKMDLPAPHQTGDVVKTVKSDPKGNVWASRERDVLRLEGNNRWKSIPVDDSLTRVLQVDGHYLWLVFPWDIVGYPIDKIGDVIRNSDAALRFPVPRNTFCGLVDRSGTVWAGTMAANGVIKFNTGASRFRHFFQGQNINAAPFIDNDGNVCFLDYEKGFRSSSRTSANPLYPLEAIPGSRLLRDGLGNDWVTGKSDKAEIILVKIEPSGRRRTFSLPISGTGSGTGNMTLDENGQVWMAMYGRLLRFDPMTESFFTFDYRSIVPELHLVYALAKTKAPDGKSDYWWLGTEKGLVRFTIADTANQETKLFKNEPANRNSLRSNKVSSLLTDPADSYILWIGTKGGGLNRLDTRTMQFSHITSKDGLPNDVIYGVLADDEGHLWLSSNKGIIRYTPANSAGGIFKNYTEEDGVQSNEFNSWAYGKASSGALLFGGVNGVNVFHPNDLEDDPFMPNVFITGLRINDEAVSLNGSRDLLKQAVEFTDNIVLPFSENNVALEFASLDFAIPGKNRYQYYLEGIEKPWSHEGTDNMASYLKLAPGDYVFYVKGSNSDGVWNETPALLKITVLPPWYQTWWAYLCYLLVVGGIAYGFYWYQLRRKLEHAENLRLKELDAFKSRFFTNISHEFRTPLTVILGTTEQLSSSGNISSSEEVRLPKPKFQNQLALIKRNGENLLRLITQILDLARLEANTLQLHYIQGDVLAYLRYITESLASLASTKKIILRFESDQAQIVMDYDTERLLQIIYNLLSNAIKFTPSGGSVVLRVSMEDLRLRQQGIVAHPPSPIVIKVTDTGIGIPSNDLPFVFDRFFQAQNQEHNKAGGTGIGLSLTKELIKAMGGDISVESTVGQGTAFTVVLPVKNAAEFAKEDLFIPAGRMTTAADVPIINPKSSPDSHRAETQSSIVNRLSEIEQPSLLIIEDNPDIVEYLVACLSEKGAFGRSGYQLEVAYNGREGIEKALETVPDIIISDVMMPEKDGFEVCDFLKNDERTSHIPIVLLTAKATLEDRIAGLRRGADAYLAKPFHPEELLVTLSKLVELRRKLQARYASLAPMPPKENEGLQPEDAFFQKVRNAVEEKLDDAAFTVNDLCRAMAMSQPQLHRKLTALTGKNATLFIRQIRLQQAKALLSKGGKTVSEVAFAVGFDDPKYFSRIFAEEFGIPPSKFLA